MNGRTTVVPGLQRMSTIGLLCAMTLVGAACTGSSPVAASSAQPSATEPSSSASEDNGQLDGCMPRCKNGNSTTPAYLPAGEYQTEWFFGGEMRLTFDDSGWTSREDSTGEFVVSPSDVPDENDILFWEDVYPVEPPTGTWNTVMPIKMRRIAGVPLTAAGLLDWMTSSSQLQVSAPTPGTIGDIPATVVDVSVADDAVNDDPNCPVRACFNFLGFPQWDGPWGIAGGPVRFYLSDVTYGGRDHLFVAAIYPVHPDDMKTLGRAGERLIRTVRVAADPA
jgi:hypothetical protein